MKMMTKLKRWPSGVQIITGVTSIAVIVGL